MLLVLDDCRELVIENAARLVVEILRRAPGVQILATSREPLRAPGECVHRLSSLPSPPAAARITASRPSAFRLCNCSSSVRRKASNEFALSDADAPVVAQICSKLDGNPLAIEFAAARVDAFGLSGLASCLVDRFQLLTSGHRTTISRHDTMSATLDWSYELLTESERLVLCRIAVFPGDFRADEAT